MYFNGIVLISSVLDLGTISFNAGEDMPYVFYLPSYAATAWYHKVLKDRPDNLAPFLDEARKYAQTDYADALMKGSKLGDAEKAAVAKKLSRFTGLSEDYLVKADLRVILPQFTKELQRSRGLITGRLDARFSGRSYDLLGEFAEYDPQDTSITGPFTAAFNTYVRDELKFGQDKVYDPLNRSRPEIVRGIGNITGPVIISVFRVLRMSKAIWFRPCSPTHILQVEMENGLYDLATPFLATEYTMDHLGLPEKL